MAIAASQAGGLVAKYCTMTKPFHAGRSAQVGVLSARLADAGMTAAAGALESGQGDFRRALASPKGEVDVETPPALGRTWWLLKHGLGFKLYPMCYGTHRALDGMLDLVRELYGCGAAEYRGDRHRGLGAAARLARQSRPQDRS